MTAEERATALCWNDDEGEATCEHSSSGLACERCITAAILAAETEARREALEEAGEIVRSGACDLGSCSHVACIWAHDAAEDIAALAQTESST